jgi:phage gpG-like protein
VGARVIADVINHFEQERGPTGKWKAWSPAYRKYMQKRGKGGNKILQDTGRLRTGWQPARYRTSREGITWFNPVEYAGAHDRGTRRLPKREFSWISRQAIEKIEKDTAKFLLKD